LAGIESMRDDNIFSFRTNKEAIDFISQNNGMIGVVGLNWVLESKEASQSDIRVLAVKSDESSEAITPTQSNIALGKYPLARDLFIINAQGYAGLGMGFGSFITGDRGQRIILKSGLLPVRLPSRNILVRDQIQKK
nr:substrate-binding domain-containing protein [Flavobacterium sp.]